MKTIFIGYIPVLHQGYLQILAQLTDMDEIWLLDKKLLLRLAEKDDGNKFAELSYLKKDIRALPINLVMLTLKNWFPKIKIKALEEEDIWQMKDQIDLINNKFLLTDDDIGHLIAEELLAENSRDNISFSSIFLRWDRKKATTELSLDNLPSIPANEFLQKIGFLAQEIAGKSSDWWRQVGAVVAKNDEILLTGFNRHLPSEQQPYLDGDVRALFHKGDHIELTTAIHAEASVIAAAARQGIKLEGADLFVTTFPCPVCAKLVAAAGIKTLYFHEGYAMLDGETILSSAGVTIIRLETSN